MFRRKEEDMTDIENTQQNNAKAEEASKNAASKPAATTPAPAKPATATPGAASSTAAYPISSMPRSNESAATARPQTPAAPISSNSPAPTFRPANAPQTDLTRNRPADKPSFPAAPTASSSPSTSAAVANIAEKAKDNRRILTVGADIHMKGEITTCDRVIIEGKVDAILKDVGLIELADNGSFKGIAEVESAEISGSFEGEMHVAGRLVIYSSGKVSGKISYGEIEIERGGQLSGEITSDRSAPAKTARKVSAAA